MFRCSRTAVAVVTAVGFSAGCLAIAIIPAATSAQTAQKSPHGRLTLITEPQDGIAPVLSAVNGARHQVDMVMYEDNDTQVDAALAADARRGVAVRVLLNGGYYGQGFPQDETAYDYLKAHGVPVRWAPSFFALTHQKTLVVDRRAYILTFNLTPQYYASSRDFGVIDTIPADDAAIEQTFNADWSGRRVAAATGSDLVWSPGSQSAQVELIESATAWVDVYNEEMDSPAIESALEGAARRGVDVRITMTADSAWDGAFTQLAAAGVHVRTYTADSALYIHAKMILTPNKVFLGSENFSAVSMNKNRELGLITSDATIRASLSRTFDTDYAKAAPYVSGGGTSSGGGSSTSAQCSVTASYNSTYDDWDVYVHSNQPETSATVSDSSGTTASYDTDASGYGDIYLKAPASAAGQKVTIHVGHATCTGIL
jgi:phosphatidylserine/phosphatidylglycerophosphate/cardiolipin synthase-like enzyme